jgi:hypothetical protein
MSLIDRVYPWFMLGYRGEPKRHENPTLMILDSHVFVLAAGIFPGSSGFKAVQQSLV